MFARQFSNTEIFIDAETGTHISKTETGTVASRYTKINFETAKNASMEDFVDFAFNESFIKNTPFFKIGMENQE